MLDTKFFLNLKSKNYIKSFDLIKKAYDFSKSKHDGLYRDDGKDYFFHASGVSHDIYLKDGDNVEYKVVEGERGPKAVDVSPV